MIKKILATISTFLLLSLSVSAMGMGGVGGGVSSPQYWKLTSGVLSPIDSSWSLNVAGGITFGASTMSGALNMNNNNVLNATRYYLSSGQNGIGAGVGSNIGIYLSNTLYHSFTTSGLSLEGGRTLTVGGTNANLTLLPKGTGYINASTELEPVSLGTSGGLNTTNLEASGSIFTGGTTFATNRGDVPVWDFLVTSAAPAGSAQGYPIKIDGQFIFYPYAESDGAGGIQNKEVRTVNIRNYGDLISERITLPNDTTLPATCAVGEVFVDTDSDDCSDTPAGSGKVCICLTADTWSAL